MSNAPVEPGKYGGFLDLIFPRRHSPWWNRHVGQEPTAKTAEELLNEVRSSGEGTARLILEHVEAIAQSATDRAAAADRRATTIAGTVAIAASLTLSGTGVLIDRTKWSDANVRTLFAVVLFITTFLFVASACYALVALVAQRGWNWTDPHHLDHNIDAIRAIPAGQEPETSAQRQELLERRAAQTMDQFAENWEISDQKNRMVDNALFCLIAALSTLTILAVLVIIEVS